MERNKERYYTTGQFAEYFKIKKDTLFYYDKIKLFCPAKVGSNGYRYYTSSQISTFRTLLSLREIGVPIKVLQEYFRKPSPECLNEIMEKQIKKINTEMGKLQKIKKLLSDISFAVKEAKSNALGQVTITTIPDQRIVCSRQNNSSEDTSNGQWENIYDDFVRERGLAVTAYVGSVIVWEDLQKGRFGYVDRLFTVSTDKNSVIREGGTYAQLYHKGNYNSIPPIYPYLISETENLGYSIAGNAYEEYLISEIATDCADDFITKIIVKVAPTIVFLSCDAFKDTVMHGKRRFDLVGAKRCWETPLSSPLPHWICQVLLFTPCSLLVRKKFHGSAHPLLPQGNSPMQD